MLLVIYVSTSLVRTSVYTIIRGPWREKKNNIYNPHVNDTIMHGGRVIDLDDVKGGGY